MLGEPKSFIPSFIHSFDKCLFNLYPVLTVELRAVAQVYVFRLDADKMTEIKPNADSFPNQVIMKFAVLTAPRLLLDFYPGLGNLQTERVERQPQL